MAAGAMTRTTAALAALVPWFAVLPLHGAAAVLAQAALFVAAAHGAGQVAGALAGRERTHPLLAFQLGLAALVAISGLAIALGVDTLALQIAIACTCAGAHSAIIVARWHELPELRAGGWLAPALLLLALVLVHVLGAAGDLGDRPFDDDGHVLAQLQRLRDTGALADGAGYARASQLGGQLALTALATVPGDVHLARVLEALAFAGAVGLVVVRIRPGDPAAVLWSLLVVIAASALAFAPLDLAPCWTIAGLVLALHALLDEPQPHTGLVALVAGALIALRLELAPLALAAIGRAWWPARRDARAAWGVALGLVIAAVPLALARSATAPAGEVRHLLVAGSGAALSWPVAYLGLAVPAAVLAALAVGRAHRGRAITAALVVAGVLALALGAPALGRAAVFVALGTPSALLVAFALRAVPHRWLAIGGALVAVGVLTGTFGERAYALRLLWPLGIAAALAGAIHLARALTLTTAAMIASIAVLALIHEGREATGRTKWTRRYLELAQSIEYVRHSGTDAPVAGGYAALLAKVPRGATVALWVARPERLDYRTHRFVDLRTPRAARLRVHRFDAHTSQFAELVAATGADYLLLEEDLRGALRVREDWLERFVCGAWSPACADDLEAIALDHPIIATDRGVRLVKLR